MDLTFQPLKILKCKIIFHCAFGNSLTTSLNVWQWVIHQTVPINYFLSIHKNPSEIRRIYLIKMGKQINMWIWHDKPFDSLKSSFFKNIFLLISQPFIFIHSSSFCFSSHKKIPLFEYEKPQFPFFFSSYHSFLIILFIFIKKYVFVAKNFEQNADAQFDYKISCLTLQTLKSMSHQ